MTLVLHDPINMRSLCSVCSAEPGSFVILSPGVMFISKLKVCDGMTSPGPKFLPSKTYHIAVTISMFERFCYLLTPSNVGWVDITQEKVLDWQSDEAALLNNDYAWAKCP